MKRMSQNASDSETLESTPSVSIILVNFNGAKLLPGCLNSLGALHYPKLEVILVDNNSSDNSLQILENYSSVQVVRSHENSGFTGGNNLGLKRCSGEYVLLLNNDTVVQPGFLESLCDYLKKHPTVGVVQGKMILPRFGNTLDVCGSFLTRLGLPYHYGYFKPDSEKYRHTFPVFCGRGACLMFRRDIIPQVGGFLFDEDFFCYYEESDFCHRVWLAGWEVHFVPSPPIQHLMGATGDRILKENRIRELYLRNMIFSLFSNLSAGSILRLGPPLLGILTLSMLYSLLTLNMAGFKAHVSAVTDNLFSWQRIRSRRKLIRAIRRKTDREIFAKTLRNPKLNYFVKTFRGKIADYVDEEI